MRAKVGACLLAITSALAVFGQSPSFVRLDPGHHLAQILAAGQLKSGRIASISADETVRVWPLGGESSETDSVKSFRYRVGLGDDGLFTAGAISDTTAFVGVAGKEGSELVGIDLVASTNADTKMRHVAAHKGRIDGIGWSPDRSVVVTTSGPEMKLWNLPEMTDGGVMVDSEVDQNGKKVDADGWGKSLLAVGKSVAIRVVQYQENPIHIVSKIFLHNLGGNASAVASVHFDGTIASVGYDGKSVYFSGTDAENTEKLYWWDGKSPTTRSVKTGLHVTAFGFIDGVYYAGDATGNVYVAATGQLQRNLGAGPISTIGPLAKGGVIGTDTGRVVVSVGSASQIVGQAAQPIQKLGFSLDGKKLLIAAHSPRGFDLSEMVPSDAPSVTEPITETTEGKLSTNGDSIFLVSPAGPVSYPLKDNDLGSTSAGNFGFVPGSDGKQFYVAGTKKFGLFQLGALSPFLKGVQTIDAPITAVCPSPDGHWFAIGYADGKVRLYRTEGMKLDAQADPVLTLFLAPESNFGDYVVWNEQTGVFFASPGAFKFTGLHVNGGPDELAKFVPCSEASKLYDPESLKKAFADGAMPVPQVDLSELSDSAHGIRLDGVDNAKQLNNEGTEFEASQSSITVNVRNSGKLKNLRIATNNLTKDVIATQTDIQGLHAELSPGNNYIKITGETEKGVTEQFSILVRYGQAIGTLHVLAMGVGDYAHINKLTAPAKDAKAVADFYGDPSHMPGIRKGKVELISEASADSGTLRDKLKALASSSDVHVDDDVMVYLSAHGYTDTKGNFYLLTRDSDVSSTGAVDKAITGNELMSLLSAIRCRRVLLVADTCFSGHLIQDQIVALPKTTPSSQQKSLVEMGNASNVVILTSCAPWELSYQADRADALSDFTDCFLKQLEESTKGTGTFDNHFVNELNAKMHEKTKDRVQTSQIFPVPVPTLAIVGGAK